MSTSYDSNVHMLGAPYKNVIIVACNNGIRCGSLPPVAFRRHRSSSHVQTSILIADAVPYTNLDNEKVHGIDDQVVVMYVHLFGWSCVGNEPRLSW